MNLCPQPPVLSAFRHIYVGVNFAYLGLSYWDLSGNMCIISPKRSTDSNFLLSLSAVLESVCMMAFSSPFCVFSFCISFAIFLG